MKQLTQPEIFILGLGYLGQPLAQILVERGFMVKGIKRNLLTNNCNELLEINYYNLEEQLNDIDWSHYQSAQTWLCLLPPSSSPAQYVKVLKTFMEKAIEYKINHVIYTSSISVYPPTGTFSENYQFSSQQIADSSIIQCEQNLLEQHHKHANLVPNLDILRLGGLYSKDRHPLYRLNQRPKVKGQNHIANLCSKDQAVMALLFAIDHPNGVRVRNISQVNKPSRKEFYQQQAQLLQVKAVDFDESDNSTGGRNVITDYDDFIHLLQ